MELEVDMDYLVNKQEGYFEPVATVIYPVSHLSRQYIKLLYRKINSYRFERRLRSIAKREAERKLRYILSATPA